MTADAPLTNQVYNHAAALFVDGKSGTRAKHLLQTWMLLPTICSNPHLNS